MAQATLNPQLRGDRTLAANIVEKILTAFPDVSAEWLMRGVGTMYSNQDADDSSYMVAETPHHEEPKIEESHQDDSVWKAKYEELEKRYDQLLSILGGSSQIFYPLHAKLLVYVNHLGRLATELNDMLLHILNGLAGFIRPTCLLLGNLHDV